ncbi:protein FAM117A [Stigmatopora argus]
MMDNRPSVRRSRVHVKKTTPSCSSEETQSRRSLGGHKRPASWGSAEHLKEVAKLRQQLQKRSRHAAPSAAGCGSSHHALTTGVTQTSPLVPLNRLASRLRRSVEGLNLELEEVFVSEKQEDQHEFLDIPDGHRAPAPVQRCSSGSQSESSPGPLDLSLLSPSQSPCPLDHLLLSPSTSPCPLNPLLLSPTQSPQSSTREFLCPSPPTFFPSYGVDPPALPPRSTSSSPPCLDQSLFFNRQPAEGGEALPMCQDTMFACSSEPLHLQPSCPDLNKVNFTPHGGSAFCPVSLLKPLLPSMDLLFRGLSVSPVTGCPGQVSPTRQLGIGSSL